jgi:hypothetical protein
MGLLILAMGCRTAETGSTQASHASHDHAAMMGQSGAAPAVEGTWAGEWGPYNPAQNLALKKENCNIIGAKVARVGDKWKADFEGQCSRPYAYAIEMDGEQHGDSVMFKGTVDLGPADGGVYDWVGRANGDEFVGFYTNAYHTGVFHMAKVDAAKQ